MSEFVIEKGIVIDDIETVFEGIKELSNKSISGPEDYCDRNKNLYMI